MKQNNKIILLVLVNIISGTGYSLIAPLYPAIAAKRGISDLVIGFIISSFAISNLITTPFGSKIFKLLGKRNVFLLSMLIAVKIKNFLQKYFLKIRQFVLLYTEYLKMWKIKQFS